MYSLVIEYQTDFRLFRTRQVKRSAPVEHLPWTLALDRCYTCSQLIEENNAHTPTDAYQGETQELKL